jgi:hypothetical protein
MPKIQYKRIDIRAAGRTLIKQVNAIIEQYADLGYSLTLRQVYYQMVARDIIPNNMNSYNMLGDYIANGRLAGLIDWYAIEDRTRSLRRLSHWRNPGEIVEGAVRSYQRDLWETQPKYVEVWVEKDALIGIVQQVANRFDVPCFSCRGYTSTTEMWYAGQRLMSKSNDGERPVKIIHLGDHDPSGIDMTRDIEDRINLFTSHNADQDSPSGLEFTIDRIALNMDQIKEFNPPTNPAKNTDSRFKMYFAKFGQHCWELDAIEPTKLDNLISAHIVANMDEKLMKKAKKRMEKERKSLKTAVDFVQNPEDWQKKITLGPEMGYYGGLL